MYCDTIVICGILKMFYISSGEKFKKHLEIQDTIKPTLRGHLLKKVNVLDDL